MELNIHWCGIPVTVASKESKALDCHKFIALLKTIEKMPNVHPYILDLDLAAITPKNDFDGTKSYWVSVGLFTKIEGRKIMVDQQLIQQLKKAPHENLAETEGAVVHRNGEGLLHKDKGPAVVVVCGGSCAQWWKHGVWERTEHRNKTGYLHREDGPALEIRGGIKYWYLNGKLHRENGPAIERPEFKYWFHHGMLHRTDGPAIEYPDGHIAWYKHGKFVDHR